MSFDWFPDCSMKFKGIDDKVHFTILHKDDKDFFFISNYEDYTVEIEFDFGGKGSVILGPKRKIKLKLQSLYDLKFIFLLKTTFFHLKKIMKQFK